MNQLTILLAALCCAIGAAASGEQGAQRHDTKKVATDLEKVQGIWTVERVEAEGKEVPISLFEDMMPTFEGNKYTVRVGGQVVQAGTHELDQSKTPKTFDDTVVMGANQGTVIVGIYEISGGTLRFCFDPEGNRRPTEFKTAPGLQTTLGVYRRVKK